MTTLPFEHAFLVALAAVQSLIESYDNQGLVIGGVAVGAVAEARTTKDIDLVLVAPEDDVSRLISQAAVAGLVPRISDAEEFARLRRVVLLKHEQTAIPVDISLGVLPFELEAVARGENKAIGGVTVRVATPEDLIILKAVAHRPQDLVDIQTILDRNPHLDRERVRFWVQQFAEALDAPELWTAIAPLLR